MTNGISNSVFRSRLYKLALMGRGPTQLVALPPGHDDRGIPVGDPVLGQALLAGRYRLRGQIHELGDTPWTAEALEDRDRAELHQFDWLGDLAALDSAEARAQAEALFEDWDERFGGYTTVSWRADVIAARIINCLSHYGALYEPADATFRIRFLDSIARQLRHLRRVAGSEAAPAARIEVYKGLIYAEVCVADEAERLERGLALLEEELARQVLHDGSHVSRSPGRHLGVLEALIDIRAVLTAASLEVPVSLRNTIDRMAPMVRFFRHGDGDLACFHGGGRPGADHVRRVLARSDAQGQAPQRAPYAGFERVNVNGLVLILDGGPPPGGGHDDDAHAGIMSFELSAAGHCLFVNCGAGPKTDPTWREALRTTAAHTTLAVADTNSCELTAAGIGRHTDTVECDRGEIEGSTWISSSHGGYEHQFGLTHRRRLYIDRSGGDLRGEDILVGAPEHSFDLRFHLHPAVGTEGGSDGAPVILTPPDGTRWQLRVDRPAVIEDSIYWDDEAGVRPTRQIVVSSRTGGESTTVKWRLNRLGMPDATEQEPRSAEE